MMMAGVVVPLMKFPQRLRFALSVNWALSLIVTLLIEVAIEITGSLTVFGMTTFCVQPLGPPTGDVGLQLVVVAQSVLVAPVHTYSPSELTDTKVLAVAAQPEELVTVTV